MKALGRELFFGFIAILMLSELFASNLFTIFFNLERAADVMQVSPSIARNHLLTLALIDSIPGIGAALVLWAGRHADSQLGGVGVIATTLGMVAYGGYQFLYASFQLDEIQLTIQAVGVIYASLGLIAWFVAGGPRTQKNLAAAAN